MLLLDPAAGSGNFLTETYLSLRRLENEVLEIVHKGNLIMGELDDPIKVSIKQFSGIEINGYAVAVAQTALWIAESQMLKETEQVIGKEIEFLPLKSNPNIIEGNALTLDWESVVPKDKLNYIMGNPPFVGKKYRSDQQRDDMRIYSDESGKPYANAGILDYVSCWFFKASQYMNGTHVCAALVATNSITQGEQVIAMWKPLYERFNIRINFAWKSFAWDSESTNKAHVHCVIIGFSATDSIAPKKLFSQSGICDITNNISPYLMDTPVIFVESRRQPICNVPSLIYGSFALDNGGKYTVDEEEYLQLIKKEPNIKKYFKLFLGADEFINHIKRYCIWLKDADIGEVKKSPILYSRINSVKEWRSQSNRPQTKKAAQTPMLFAEIRQPDSDYLAVPITSSLNRQYIPMGYMSKEVIASNHLFVLPDATLYHLGILMSSTHMAWMRAIAGRRKSDYNYSNLIVYNNFPWPTRTDKQKAKIEQTAQSILDARAKFPDASLADLYDETTMPPELRKAHEANDKAVMAAYGFKASMAEPEIVAELLEMYQKLTEA